MRGGRGPVVLVDDHPHGRVVVGVKSSNNTHELLAQAFTEASARGAVLTAVVAWQLPDPYFDRIEARTHAEDWEAQGNKDIETSRPTGARPTPRSGSKRELCTAPRHGCCSMPAQTVTCLSSRAAVSPSRPMATSAAWSTTCCGSAMFPCSWCPSSLTGPKISKTWCSKRKASRSSEGAPVRVTGDHRRARQAVRCQVQERSVDFAEGVLADVELDTESRCEP